MEKERPTCASARKTAIYRNTSVATHVVKDWQEQIVQAWLLKQALATASDDRESQPYLPNPGASEADIQAVEHALNIKLDLSYREFLSHANGWKGFWKSVNLLATSELLAGMEHGHTVHSFIQTTPPSQGKPIRIAAAPTGEDIIVMNHNQETTRGDVVWFAGEEVQRFATFEDYFFFVVDWHRKKLKRCSVNSE